VSARPEMAASRSHLEGRAAEDERGQHDDERRIQRRHDDGLDGREHREQSAPAESETVHHHTGEHREGDEARPFTIRQAASAPL